MPRIHKDLGLFVSVRKSLRNSLEIPADGILFSEKGVNIMDMQTTTNTNTHKRVNVRYLTVTAMLTAIAYILMFFDFSVPFIMPEFIKMDLSELPALIG